MRLRPIGPQRVSFTVPVTAATYAPERITFGGVESRTNGQPQIGILGVTAMIESNAATGAVIEIWLPKMGAVLTNDTPADAEYFFSGWQLGAGAVTIPLAAYFGAQIRVKSGGTAGACVVNATASDFSVGYSRGLNAGPSTGLTNVDGVFTWRAEAELTRLNSATPYTAGDVVADTATDGTCTFLALTGVASGNGRGTVINKLILETDQAACVAQLDVHLWQVPRASLTTTTPVDNLANLFTYTGNKSKYCGLISMEAFHTGAGSNTMAVAIASGLWEKFNCLATDTALYAQLVTNTAFTPAALQKITLIAEGIGL